jgi:hypothetical protein
MGYRMLKIDHLYEVYRRVVAGESKRSIANQTGWDRKTIGKYVGILTERALLPTGRTNRSRRVSITCRGSRRSAAREVDASPGSAPRSS